MFIDHIGAAVLQLIGQASAAVPFRSIGRMSFPLFVFLLVEGFFYTHDRKRYALRLLIFSFISEIPFDLAFFPTSPDLVGSRLFFPDRQNVFPTLLFGFLLIWFVDTVIEKVPSLILKICFSAAAVYLGFFAGSQLHTDYGGYGVLAVLLGYMVKRYAKNQTVEILLIVLLLVFQNTVELFALLDLIPVYFYGGKKGRTISKWFFYFFYPAHLLILWAVRVFFIR